jgi:hypothetical protein
MAFLILLIIVIIIINYNDVFIIKKHEKNKNNRT